MIFVANHDSPLIMHPGKKAFRLSNAAYNDAALDPPAFSLSSHSAYAARSSRFQALPALSPMGQGHKALSPISFPITRCSMVVPAEPNFMRRSISWVNGEWNTKATRRIATSFRSLAPLVLSDSPLFLAETNVPSIKHSERSNYPLLGRSPANAFKRTAQSSVFDPKAGNVCGKFSYRRKPFGRQISPHGTGGCALSQECR